MNKSFRIQLLRKLQNNNFEKEAAIFEEVKKGLESKGLKPKKNEPVYGGAIRIPGAKAGVSVICPNNPIINGKYNVFFQIRSGHAPAKAGVNAIIVIAEAGGIASKENTVAFGNAAWINKQLGIIQNILSKRFGNVSLGKLGLGSFSGGYDAVGKILQDPKIKNKVDSVVILDGIHAGQRGNVDKNKMKVWKDYAEIAAKDPNKQFVFLYTAVDPGTYASTSDSAYYLTDELGIQRKPPSSEVTFAGVKPATVAQKGGFTAIQLYDRKSDKPGYGYLYHKDNREGSSGAQHIAASRALPDIWSEYLGNSWNAI